MKPTILLIGLGGLGSVTLELLAREEGLGRIVVGSRNVERGTARCNLARLSAMAQGYAPSISFVPLDLNGKEAVAETVRREAPSVMECILMSTRDIERLMEEQSWLYILGKENPNASC